jgi:PAS domain S-box-containing protein/diguanylate cyclase (GGDEF)-like protein
MTGTKVPRVPVAPSPALRAVEVSTDAVVFSTPDGESATWHRGAGLLAQLDLISLVLDRNAAIVYCCDHLLRITGWQREEVLGRDWLDVFVPEPNASVSEVFAGLLRKAPFARRHENEIRTRRGDRRWIRWHNSPLLSESGRVIGTASIGEDLSEQRCCSEEHARMQAITQNCDDAIIENTLGGIVTRWSKGAERMYGFSAAEIIGRPIEMLMPPDRQEEQAGILQRLRNGEAIHDLETVRRHKDGRLLSVQLRISPILDANGTTLSVTKIAKDITQRKRVEAELRESEWRFRQLAGSIREVLFLEDAASGRTLYVSPGYERVWGRSCESIYERPNAWVHTIHPEDAPLVLASRERRYATEEFSHEFRIVRPDGEIRWIRSRGFPIRGADNSVQRIAGVCEDITAQKEQQQKIARLSRINAVMGAINAAIVRIRDQKQLLQEACRIVVAQGAFRMAWIAALDEGASDGKVVASYAAPEEYLQTVHITLRVDTAASKLPGSRALREQRAIICNNIASDPTLACTEVWLGQGVTSGAAFPLIMEGNATAVLALFSTETNVFDEEEQELLSQLASDIAFGLQYIRNDERLRFLAYHDTLTGLPNSTFFHDQLSAALETVQDGSGAVVMLLDLDHFTRINDTLGRAVGDALLRSVAARLTKALPAPHLIARTSADSFAAAILDLPEDLDVGALVSECVLGALATTVSVDAHEVQLSAKAGVAISRGEANAATLFKNAEIALRRAQTSGEHFIVYTPALNAEAAQKLSLEAKMRRAFEQQQFVLHYQPKVAAKSGRLTGLEALIRWNDPESGLVSPARFIECLEDTGLIGPVGRWAIEQALLDRRRWAADGLQPPRIAVNVSAVQLRNPGFAETVRAALTRTGERPDALELEITESLIIEDIEANIRTLQEISELGVSVAIDDFGTGYSSLRYLAKLPVDCLKIDRSFIATMVDEPDSMTIVSTVISLAHALNLHVVAEGVETAEQAKVLKLLRCDEMQGFLFSKPLTSAACESYLRDNNEAMLTGAFRR